MLCTHFGSLSSASSDKEAFPANLNKNLGQPSGRIPLLRPPTVRDGVFLRGVWDGVLGVFNVTPSTQLNWISRNYSTYSCLGKCNITM